MTDYVAQPPGTPRAAVLLLPEMFGLTEAMRGSADRFAADGCLVLARDPFRGSSRPGALPYAAENHAIAWARVAELGDDGALADIEAALAVLRGLAPGLPVVAVGHCIGGRWAVLALARMGLAGLGLAGLGLAGLGLAGAVSYYGMGLQHCAADLDALPGPAQLHFGTADTVIPMDEVAAVAALAIDNKRLEIYCYQGAGHSFCNPNRPMYDRFQAELAHARSLALIAGQVR